jgi:hypothetical protein
VTTDDVLRLLLTGGLIGGALVALLNAFLANRTERGKRRVEFLTRQLQALYGPLDLFTGQNQQLTALRAKMDEAYSKEYEREWSEDEATQRAVKEQTSKTIEKMNEYGRRMKENNAKMVELLGKNYDLIDSDDAQMFQDFMTACVRDEIEFGSGHLDLPLRVFHHLGPVVVYDPAFVDRIRTRCQEKRTELSESRRVPRWPWQLLRRRATAVKMPDASVLPKESAPNATPIGTGS